MHKMRKSFTHVNLVHKSAMLVKKLILMRLDDNTQGTQSLDGEIAVRFSFYLSISCNLAQREHVTLLIVYLPSIYKAKI